MNESKKKVSSKKREESIIKTSWERDFRRGLLQLMILMLIRLRTTESHGYGLIRLIQNSGVPIKAGTIYPLLKRMEKDKLITSYLAEDPDQPSQPRRIYLITQDGEEMIEHMISTYQSYDETIKRWYQEIVKSNMRRRN